MTDSTGTEADEHGHMVTDLARAPRDARSLNLYKETKNLDQIGEFTALETLHVREIKPAVFEAMLRGMPNLRELSIYGTRIEDLQAIASLPLQSLRLVWAHKITSLEPLAMLDRLEALAIGDLKQVSDFSPIAQCANLTTLDIEAGMWGAQLVDSLGFLKAMPQLRELSLQQLKIGDGDVTPICSLTNLATLSLPTRYPVREYARMSVCLPNTQCEQFASHITLKVQTMGLPGSEAQ